MWKIGEGREVRVFGDAWIPSFNEGGLLQKPEGLEDLRVAKIMDDTGQWNMAQIEGVLTPREVFEVLQVEKLVISPKDWRYWKFDPEGEYSVQSGYLVPSKYFEAHAMTSEDSNVRWWKFLWSFNLPQRVRIFAWRIFRNIIQAELNLHKHHVPIFGICGWCRKGWGSTPHALLFCDKIRHHWKEFDFWKILKKWEGNEIWVIGGAMQNHVSRDCFEQWLMGMWLIWKGLCEEKHKNRSWSWSSLRRECLEYIEAHAAARQQAACQSRVLHPDGSRKWARPKRGRFRLDVDYAVDEDQGRGGVGTVRDSDRIIFALAKPVMRSATTLHGELKALVHGIMQCIEEDIYPVKAYTDSLLAVTVLAEENEANSVLCEDFFDFFAMANELNVMSVNHVRREANMAAHELARFARDMTTTCVWHDSWPSWLLDIVSLDFE